MSDTPAVKAAAQTAASIVTDAALLAENVIQKASATAVELAKHDEDKTIRALVAALNQVFGEKEEQQQFINLNRVPMICQQLSEIHKNIENITAMIHELQLVKKIVFGAVGMVIVGFFAVLISLVYR